MKRRKPQPPAVTLTFTRSELADVPAKLYDRATRILDPDTRDFLLSASLRFGEFLQTDGNRIACKSSMRNWNKLARLVDRFDAQGFGRAIYRELGRLIEAADRAAAARRQIKIDAALREDRARLEREMAAGIV